MSAKTQTTIETLPGALAAQIMRVTELRELYRETQRLCGPQANCAPAIAMMTASLVRAVAAAGSPDVVGQAQALNDLRGLS